MPGKGDLVVVPSSSSNLEYLFPEHLRGEIFEKALSEVLASKQIEASQRRLAGLKDPPDLRTIAKNSAQDAWKRISGEVEKHLQLLRARELRQDELRQSVTPDPENAETEEAYKRVSGQYEQVAQRVTRLEFNRSWLYTLHEQAVAAQTVADAKLRLAKYVDSMFGGEAGLNKPQQRPATGRSLANSSDAIRSASSDATQSALQATITRLTTTKEMWSKRLQNIDFARQNNSDDLAKARSAAYDVAVSQARLELQLQASLNRQLQGFFRVDPKLRELDAEILKSSESLQTSLARHGIQPVLIQAINKALGRIYATNVSLRGVILDSLSDTDHRHPTETWARVERLIGSAATLSIGLSGPRGAGKTTLIDWVCAGRGIFGRPSGLGIAVSAPSDYAPREFLLYLYSELCRATLRFTGRLSPDSDVIERKGRWEQRLTYAIAAMALLMLGSATYLAFQELGAGNAFARTPVVAALVITAVLAIFGLAWRDAKRICDRLITNVGAANLAFHVRDRLAARDRNPIEERSPKDFPPPQYRPSRLRFPRLRLPRLRLPRLRFPRLRFPRLRFPRLRFPRLRLPGLRRPRLPRLLRLLFLRLRFPQLPMPVLALLAIAGLGVIVGVQPVLGSTVGRKILVGYVFAFGLISANYAMRGPIQSFIAATVPIDPEPVLRSDLETPESNTKAFSVLARVTSAICLRRGILLMSCAIGLLIAGGALLTNSAFSWGVSTAVTIIGFAAMIAFVYLFELRIHLRPVNVDAAREPDPALLEMSKLAQEGLDLVEYQLSFTRGWTAGVTSMMPVGPEVLRTAEQTSQRLEVTLPELVGRFRVLAGKLATHRNLLIFGVDELDKIEKAEDARSFLNSLKGVFGVPRCYYLVSMSDDAFADFERRGIPFRSAFDSCFDDVIYVGYVSFNVAQAILDDNIIGMSIPFQGLCFCLAGGLPRELIRYTRQLGDLTSPEVYLDVAARQLLQAEILSQIDAALIGLRGSAEGASQQDALLICRMLRATPMRAVDLYSFCQRFCERTASSGRQWRRVGTVHAGGTAQTGRELVAFAYFAATVLEFFRRDLTQKKIKMAEGRGEGSFDQLAGARKSFSSGPAAVWHEINVFRRMHGMETLSYPFWGRVAGSRR